MRLPGTTHLTVSLAKRSAENLGWAVAGIWTRLKGKVSTSKAVSIGERLSPLRSMVWSRTGWWIIQPPSGATGKFAVMGRSRTVIRCRVSTVARLAEATVCGDHHHNLEHAAPGYPLVRLVRHCSTVRPYQGAHSMLVVASGETDVALDSGGGPLRTWSRKLEALLATFRDKPVLSAAHSSSLTVVFTVRSLPPWVRSRGLRRRIVLLAGITPTP